MRHQGICTNMTPNRLRSYSLDLWSSITYSISQEIYTRFCCALLCCGYAIVHNEFLGIYCRCGHGPHACMIFQYTCILWPLFAIQCNWTAACQDFEWYHQFNIHKAWLQELKELDWGIYIYSYSSFNVWHWSTNVLHKMTSYHAGPMGILVTSYIINSSMDLTIQVPIECLGVVQFVQYLNIVKRAKDVKVMHAIRVIHIKYDGKSQVSVTCLYFLNT